MKITISKPHSSVDLITNSSTVIFTVDNSISVYNVEEMIREKAYESDGPYDMEWFNNEVNVSENEDGTIRIYSFLNEPDWFYDFIEKNFNVIDYDN